MAHGSWFLVLFGVPVSGSAPLNPEPCALNHAVPETELLNC